MILVLFGPPGSGKGTQAALLVRRMGIPHISSGDLLRDAIASGSPLGKEVESIVDRGALVPNDRMIQLIEARLKEADAAAGALLDGFPRTTPQAEALDATLLATGRRIGAVLVLDVANDVLVGRLLNRGEVDHRSDDSIDVIRRRMETFERDTYPVLAYYESSRAPVIHINGDGGAPEVAARIDAALSGDGVGYRSPVVGEA